MWLVIGLVIGAGLVTLVLWLRNRRIAVTRYEWLIGAIGLGLLLFTIQNIVGSLAELEPVAPRMFLLVFGLPAIVLLVVGCLLPWFRYRRAANQLMNDCLLRIEKGGIG